MPLPTDRSDHLTALRAEAHAVAAATIEAGADAVDREARWPADHLAALGAAGLLGLNVDVDLGGRGEGMAGLAVVTEEVGRACGSTGLVYGMHCVASKVLGVKPTEDQRRRILAPIAAGEHVTTLALSEPGTGVHFYLPRATYRRDGERFLVHGEKSFVTSAGHADSYVLSVVEASADLDPGAFSCLLLEAGTEGASFGDGWDGFGMRGNSSRNLQLVDARVPVANLLGAEGDETWYLFEVIAPYFIVAMTGVYLGVARAALEAATAHLRERTYAHTGTPLGAEPVLAHKLGDLWTTVERSRQLLHHAADLGDRGLPEARPALFATKADIAAAAERVTNDAMTLTGGRSYARSGPLARALRDARAAHVMAPSTDLLRTWLGRSLLDLPLL